MIDPVTGTESSTPLTTGPNASAARRITAARTKAAPSRSHSSTAGMRGSVATSEVRGRNSHAIDNPAPAMRQEARGEREKEVTAVDTIAKLAQPAPSAIGQRFQRAA